MLPEVARIPSLERPVPVPPPRRAALTPELQQALESDDGREQHSCANEREAPVAMEEIAAAAPDDGITEKAGYPEAETKHVFER